LVPEYISHPGDYGVQLPNIHALRNRGSWADGVIGQYPSSTYPSHTSIATGVRPARHGVFQNTRFDPQGGGAWFFESSTITAPTLWQQAKAAGLVTAGVSWPVTVGSTIDFLYPEVHQNPPDTTWLELSRHQSTPGLIDAVVEDLGGFGARDNLDPVKRDRFATAVATHIIKKYRPNLMMIHLVQTDYAQHATGRHSIESRHAFSRLDAHVGEIVTACNEAGILGRTALVITGDHGFYRVHSSFLPNVVLRQAGLIETGPDGAITEWRAIAHRTAIRIKDPSDSALASQVQSLFQDLADGPYQGLLTVIDRQELDRLGADPEASLILEPAEGYAIGGSIEGDEFVVASSRRGNHGYLPTMPAMHTGLVLSGSGVLQGVSIPIARQIDIAPTVARLLGFEMEKAEGIPMVGVLEAH
jgi:arylsulfatase A-like enzyme